MKPAGPGVIDFDDYYVAARLVSDDRKADIYAGATGDTAFPRGVPPDSAAQHEARRAGLDHVDAYLYPPIFADALTPLSRLAVHDAEFVWRLFNWLSIVLLAIVVSRWLKIEIRSTGFCLMILSLWWADPSYETLVMGQVSLLMTLLWAISLVAYAEGAIVFSAVALAAATSIKVTPLILLPVMLIWKERRWVWTFCLSLSICAGIMLAINGTPTVLKFLRVMTDMSRGSPVLENKSITALVSWVYYRRVVSLAGGAFDRWPAPHGLLLLTKGANALFYVVCVWLIWRHRETATRLTRQMTFAVFAMVACLLSPLAWKHTYAMGLLPLLGLWVFAVRGFVSRPRLVLLTATSFAVGAILFDRVAAHGTTWIRAGCTVMWPLSCIALCFDVLYNGVDEGCEEIRSEVGSPIRPGLA